MQGQKSDRFEYAITCTFEDNKLPFDLSDGKNIDEEQINNNEKKKKLL